MNEKLQYAEMLGIPASTSSVTYKPLRKVKRSKKVDADKVKDELINKINLQETEQTDNGCALNENEKTNSTEIKSTNKAKFKFTVVGVQLIIIGLLLATIFITNALVPDSGINVFMRNVFSNSPAEEVVDNRTHKDFEVLIPVSETEGIIGENGVLNLNQVGSLYCSVDGVVTNVVQDTETKKYTIEVTHNDNFKTVFNGLDYAYSEIGANVYANVPVGYIKDTATMCFYDGNNAVITGYTLTGNQVVWEV